jgi:hypothetical protein
MLQRVGGTARDAFIASTPGLADLKRKLENHTTRYGWLPGLDGRRVPVRAKYTVLNYIVTSSEAIICKLWLVRVYDELCARFRYGWDGDVVLVLWIHDELVAACRPEIAAAVGEIMTRHGREAGEFYGFRVPLEADYTVGSGWAEPPGQGEAPEQQGDEAPIELEPVDGVQAKTESSPLPPESAESAEVDSPESAESSFDEPSESTESSEESAESPEDDPPESTEAEDDDTPHGGSGPHGRGDDGFGDDDFGDDEPPASGKTKPPKPFSDAHLKRQGYQEVLPNFDHKLVDGTTVQYQKIRYELKPGVPEILPGRPRKTFLVCHPVNDVWMTGAGPRRIPYNWQRLLCAPPGSNVFAVEGEGKVLALHKVGLLATTTAFHEWSAESIAALAGKHVFVLADL